MTRRMTRAAAPLLALALAGCGTLGLGGDQSEAERTAEQLRTPPNVLASRDRGAAADTTAGDPADVSNDSGADAPTGQADATGGAGAATDPAGFLRTVDDSMVLDTGLPVVAGWAILGRALERSGFALADSDREARTHLIRYNAGAVIGLEADAADGASADADGPLAALAFWRGEETPSVQTWQLRVSERGKGSRIALEWPDGEPAPASAARQVLAVVAEQLKP